MKTKMKRALALLLTAVMAVLCFSTVAVSAEEPIANTFTCDFQITSEMPSEGYVAMSLADIDQTFTMTTSHRGADRTYSGSNLAYVISITDADGNAVDNVVAVELYDYNSTTAIHRNEITAHGGATYYTVPIVANRVYYFRYTKVSGTTRTLRVHMQISSY